MKPEDLQPPLRLDAEVGLDEINFQTLAELEKLKPHGQGNPACNFARAICRTRSRLQHMGAEKQHVKMWVTDGTAEMDEAVWWNGGEKSLPVGKFDLAFVPQINQFNGSRTIQLKVLDWQPANL